MPELVLSPRFLERSIEPSLMAPEMMRVAENVDPTHLDGRLRRLEGYARTRISPNTYTINSIEVIQRYDGARMVIYGDTNGSIFLTVPEGTEGCGRSLVEWNDADSFGGSVGAPFTGTAVQENFNEETDAVTDPEVGGY